MEALAIISNLLHFVLAILAIYFCITLFRRHGACGWLLLGAVFLEPFVLLVMRVIHGHPLLAYKTMSAGSDGIGVISYKVDFPVLYIISVIGLFLLVRQSQKKDG